MSTTSNSHNLAMDLVESAVLERMRGNGERTLQLYAQALELEMTAIQEFEQSNGQMEPTWSVLHRSAGWMALNSNQFRLAEQIAAGALAGNPHPEIAEELRDLLEEVNAGRHLALRGVSLTSDEIQLSLSGPGVGFGRARTSDLIGRFTDITKLVHRVVEHRGRRPFRERGPRQDVTDRFPTFVSVPRGSSFAATITIGQPTQQLTLPGLLTTNVIVDDFMDVLEMTNNSELSELRERIPNSSYLRNFIGLVRKIAPDGYHIRQVGLTSVSDGKERHLSINTPVTDLPLPPIGVETLLPLSDPEPVLIEGVLLYADAIKDNVVRIVDDFDRDHALEVPEGMMNDIVRPHWNSRVTVTGLRAGGRTTLQDIQPKLSDRLVSHSSG